MTKAEQLRRVRDNYKTLLDAHAGLIAENMMNKRRIAELKERLWTYDNALKMTMDEKCSGDQEHCGCVPILKGRLAELQSRLHLIIDLGFDYDGFEAVTDLKTLIDDMVKVARGEDAELESERARLREFVEYVLGVYAWDCVDPLHEPDGGSLQDKAEKLKLIEKRPAPQSYRDEWDEDEWYQCVWTPKEADAPKRGKNPDLPSFEDVRGIFPKEADDVVDME